MGERRKSLRRRVLKAAKIVFNNDMSVVDCTVRNLSAEGALLVLPNTVGIPAHFDLVLEGDARRLACDVLWRHEQRLGVLCADRAQDRS
jgi:hypothetical protein